MKFCIHLMTIYLHNAFSVEIVQLYSCSEVLVVLSAIELE